MTLGAISKGSSFVGRTVCVSSATKRLEALWKACCGKTSRERGVTRLMTRTGARLADFATVSARGMRWIQWIVCPILALAFPLAVRSQASVVISGQVVNLQGVPQPFATVRICPQTASGIPCTPLASIYSDPGLTTPIANPTAANQYGFFSVFVGTGTSLYQVQTTYGTTTYPYWANGFIGGVASFSPTGLQFATSSSAARVATPGDIATLLSTLTGCSTPNYFYSPGSAICAASGGTPASPAFAVQFANSSASAFQADSSITINPTTHQFTAPNVTVGAPVTSSFITLNGTNGNVSSYTLTSSANNVINVMAAPYSAACNLVVKLSGGTIAASSVTLTGSGFTAASVGQTIVIWGAGAVQANGSYAPLVTTIQSYTSSTSITLAAAATTAVTNGAYEIGTLDTTAIQNAYNAAALSNQSLLFPANAGQSCLTGTIDLSAGGTVSYPVTRRGQGSVVSSITGLPGQDIFQWPDGRKMSSAYQHLEGLSLVVDASLDVSSATGGAGQIWNPCNYSAGACTTPGYTTTASRVTGQCANGSGGLAACSPAISPGPVAFLGGSLSVSSDTTCDELTIPTYGNWFVAIPPWQLAGMPISIPSISITGTITQFISNTQVIISPAYGGTCSSATGLTGTWGTPTTPPWYVGNVAEAIPASAGANAGGYQGIVDDVWITQQAGTVAFANHAGGFFFQQVPYFAKFSRITIQNLYYGYIEALPASGNQITWTPDTSHYFDISISTFIPLVQYAGNHRILDGVSIYSANHPLSLGPFFLNAALNGAGNSTVTHFYAECWGATYGGGQFGNTGENQRWSGSQWTINGGSLTQCNGPYVNWAASQSLVTDTEIGGPNAPTASTGGLQLSGSNNVFDQIYLAGNSANSATGVAVGQVNDSGSGNRVSDTKTGTRVYAVNAPQPVSGMLDGAFAQTGDYGCSFASSADLFTRYNDWAISATGITTTYAQDFVTNDGNIAGSYVQLPANGSGGNIRINFWGSPMSVGYRMPQCGTINAVVFGEAPGGATTFTVKIYDQTTSTLLTTCNYNLTTGWAFHGQAGSADACTFSTSALATGDVIDAFAYSSATYAVNMGSLTFTPQASNVVAQAFTPVGAGSTTRGTVSNFQVSATNPISNYFGAGYVEVESNGTCESVSQQGGTFTYSTATDANCEGWTAGTNISTLTGIYNPGAYNGGFSIAKSGSTYYMIVDNGGTTAGAGKLYLLSAASLAGPWTAQNGGSPVLSAGASGTATYYMYNPALAIVGSNWLLLIEGGSSTVTDGYISYSYATGCPSSCSFTTNLTGSALFGASGQVDNLGWRTTAFSPQFIYVPDKSAVVALMALQRAGAGNTYLGAYTIASGTPSALATYSNWTQAPGFQIWFEGLTNDLSDPRLYFSPTVGLKGFNGILSMYTNSALGTWQAYSPLTIDQWYQSIVTPAALPVPTWANQNGSGSPLMSLNPSGPVNFSVYPTSTFSPSWAVRGIAFDAGGAGTQSGLTGQANFANATGGSTDTLRGVQGIVNQASSGYTLSNGEAGYFQVQAGGSGDSLTNGYGVYVDSPSVGVSTGYGLYVASQANATTHYGIYQAGSTDTNQIQGPTTFNNTVSQSITASATANGFSSQPMVTATSGTVTAIIGQPNFQTGSAASTGTIRGVAGLVTQNLSGYNLATMEGGYFKAGTSGPTYTATNAYAAYLDSTGAGVTNGYGLYIASQSNATNHWGIYQAGATDTNYFAAPLTSPGIIPNTIYSAAGTALPACAAGIKGERAVVSDATSPAYMGAYTSGGGITAEVICSYNGTTYAWLTH